MVFRGHCDDVRKPCSFEFRFVVFLSHVVAIFWQFMEDFLISQLRLVNIRESLTPDAKMNKVVRMKANAK